MGWGGRTPGFNDVVIDAHGAQVISTPFSKGFRVPAGKTLHFYGPDEASVWDDRNAWYRMLRKELTPYETIRAGEYSNDYYLSKFKHNKDKHQNYQVIENLLDQPGVKMDLISVRNRWEANVNIMTLSKLLAILDRSIYKYQNVHCFFCRNSSWEIGNYGKERSYDIVEGYFREKKK